MADRIVVDASVAIALIMPESASATVRAVMGDWSRAGVELSVPSHFWLELTNVLVRRHAMPAAEALAALVLLDDLSIRTVELDRPMLLLALDRMVALRLSAYDAAYLALALATDARLATLDRRLADASGERRLLLGDDEPRRAREATAAYASDAPAVVEWAHAAAVGARIATLRSEVGSGRS